MASISPHATAYANAPRAPCSQKRDTLQEVGPNASALKFRPGIELQCNPGKTRFELFRGELAAPRGRVVEIEGFSIIAFQDEKVVELPEQNKRKRQILELANCARSGLCTQCHRTWQPERCPRRWTRPG